MSQSHTYVSRRGEIETYFDRTAVEAWRRLTSDEPVNGIRATVRAGRERMRATLLSWLPEDLSGRRVLDAGCGTGAASIELARRGASVVAIDLSPKLVAMAHERLPADLGGGSVSFRVGDMLDPALGRFDHVLAMDSIIHYQPEDAARVLAGLAARTNRSLLCTFAPRTPLLAAMHAVGRLFPSSATRAPAIVPVGSADLTRRFLANAGPGWRVGRTERVSSAFYKSQALEILGS
jgi:magnesium-protoporphyrin O-methyltransferase